MKKIIKATPYKDNSRSLCGAALIRGTAFFVNPTVMRQRLFILPNNPKTGRRGRRPLHIQQKNETVRIGAQTARLYIQPPPKNV